MSLAISSAIPNDLSRYSTVGSRLNAELVSEAGYLAGVLSHFEATCREPGYSLRVSHLADELRGYARQTDLLDRWVGVVGIGFSAADSGRRIISWAERVVGGVLVVSVARGGRYLNISLGWVRTFGLTPSGVRTFLGITATRIRFENFLKYWDKVIGKAALFLLIAIKWAEDFRDYTGTQLISALTVDAIFAVIVVKVAAGVGALILGALAGVSLPAIVIGALVVGAAIAVAWILDSAFEGLGIRDWAINALDTAINWVVGAIDTAITWTMDRVSELPELGARTVQALDENIFLPIARGIATGVDNVTSFVDSAAQRLRQKLHDTADAAGRVISDKAIKPTGGEALELRRSLHDAMDGWGTDEDAIFSLLANASDAEKQAILNDPDLLARLERELNRGDFEQAIALLNLSTSVSPQLPVDPQPGESPAVTPSETETSPGLAERIESVITNLNVETADRYRKNRLGNNETYCNLYVMDVAKDLGIPLFGEAAKYGSPEAVDWNNDGVIDDYLNANEAVAWLKGTYEHGNLTISNQGPNSGWQTIDSAEAARLAAEGYFVIAGWQNPGGIGHMAVVRPNSTPEDIHIAQAGSQNFSDGSISRPGWSLSEVEYFVYRFPSPGNAQQQA